MKFAVRYQSRSGNTEKIAIAIANGLGVKAESYIEPLPGHVDILFLGGGTYAGKPDKELLAYMEALQPEIVGEVVWFNTASGSNTLRDEIEKILKKRDIRLSDRTFHTAGKFLLANRKRPDENDLREAEEFAKSFKQ